MRKIKKIIEKKLRYHRKHLDRYLKEVKECQQGRLTKAKASQMDYSYRAADKELAVCDALEEILQKCA